MITVAKGTWWRQSFDGASYQVLRLGALTPARAVFVGEENGPNGTPLIMTIDTADLAEVAPLVTTRAANGSDALYGVAYISAEDILCAVGNNGRVEVSTNQGLNWTSQSISGSAFWDIVGVTGNQSRFVVAGYNSVWVQNQSAIWSENWTGSRQWYGVAYRPGAGWVVVGQTGWAIQSPTALNGSFGAQYQINSNTLYKVRANSTHFMAVGQLGRVFTSTTGLSGSWTESNVGESVSLFGVAPMATTDKWAVISDLGYTWYSDDNGATWTKGPIRSLEYGASGLVDFGTYAFALGGRAHIHVSFDQVQADYIAPDQTDQTDPGPAYSENADMAGDAVRRLVTQFRSGRG